MDAVPPDPYHALGLQKDAASAQIKSAYRKLALKCHPDKAPGKADEFHRIQQAYEILGDDSARQKYDIELRVAELRRDMCGSGRKGSSSSPNVDIRTAAFDVRSSPGPIPTGFTARGPQRYEERRPPPSFQTSYESDIGHDYFEQPSRSTSRKFAGYGTYARRTSVPMTPRAEESRPKMERTMSSKEKERNERKKQKDREQTKDRRGKYFGLDGEDSSDSDGSHPYSVPRRSEPHSREGSRHDGRMRDTRHSDEDVDDPLRDVRNRVFSTQDYISRASAAPVNRAPQSPTSYARFSTFQDPQYEVRKSSNQQERPSLVRRSSTKPKDKSPIVESLPRMSRRASTADRQRSPEIIEVPPRTSSGRRPPPLNTSFSSPSIPQYTDFPQRPYNYDPELAGPSLNTSKGSSPSRTNAHRGYTTPNVPSGLRNETHDSGYSTSSPSETPHASQKRASTPPPPPPPPSSYSYSYRKHRDHPDEGTASTDYPTRSNSLREPGHSHYRTPSPPARDRESRRDSVKMPPSSRSASYQMPLPPSPDAPPHRQPSLRRPSLSRSDSKRDFISGRGSGRSFPHTPTPIQTSVFGFGPYVDEPRQASPKEYSSRGPADVSRRGGNENLRRASASGSVKSYAYDVEAQAPPRRSSTQDSYVGLERERDSRDSRDRERDKERVRDRERERDRAYAKDRLRESDRPKPLRRRETAYT